MGSIGGLLGIAGGASGSGFGAPTGANIVSPFKGEDATSAAGTANNALAQQQAFLQASQAQNGLGNQSSIYNQLQGVTNGTGPNPAQAQLAQSTGANTANQAALMAGQRGSSQNAGLMARQAAMQGGANQQAAAGQAATMQANQSLNALNSQGAMANQMAGQQANATNSLNSNAQGQEGQVLGAIQGQNNANVGMQSNINSVNGQLANTTMQGQQAMVGGLANAGAAGVKALFADGGKIPQYAEGVGDVQPIDQAAQAVAPTGPMSSVGKMLHGALNSSATALAPATPDYGNPGANALYQGFANLGAPSAPKTDDQKIAKFSNQLASAPMAPATPQNDPSQAYAEGGTVPAMVSPGEKYLDPKAVSEVKKGANPMQVGETIPGKPKVGGAKNDYANDTVPKDLKEGGLILPRSVTQAKNPQWAAHAFMKTHMANGGLIPKSPTKSKGKK